MCYEYVFIFYLGAYRYTSVDFTICFPFLYTLFLFHRLMVDQ